MNGFIPRRGTALRPTRRSILAGALGAAALAGCTSKAGGGDKGGGSDGGGDATPTQHDFGSGSKTFTILGFASDLPEDEMKTFAEENDCKVSIQEYTFDKLTAMLAAGDPPDLCRGSGGTDTPYLQLKKLADPLTPYMESSSVLTADKLDPVNDLWRHDGTRQGAGDFYGIAKDYSYDLDVWVNAELAGETPDPSRPWTYDKVLEVAKKSTKGSGGRVESYGYGCYLETPHVQIIQAMMLTAGQNLFGEDLKSLDLTQDSAVTAIDVFKQLWEAGATPNPLAPSSNDLYGMFKSSRLGTFQSGYWTQGMLSDGEEAELEKLYLLPTPMIGDTQVAPVLSATGYWIPAKSKQKDLAWKFMEFHLGGESAKARASSGWGIPIIKEDQSLMPTETTMNKRSLECKKVEDPFFKVMDFTPYAKIDALNLDLMKAMEEGVKGKKSSPEIAADATERINAQLTRGQR